MLIHPSPTSLDRSFRLQRGRPAARGHLEAKGLDLQRSSGGALRGLSLDVQPGSTTHIIGSTTTDTSSLLGVLVGLFQPDRGTIHLDGKDVTELSPNNTRRSVALVLSDPWIMDTTIADNIAFGDPGVSRERIERVAALTCVSEFADQAKDGLDTPIRTDGSAGGIELTIGQRRLVALARALLRQPDVLLLEDPLRDLSTREETLAIKAINRAGAQRTSIITTTSFNSTLFANDQVFRFERGGLVPAPVGDPEAILDHGEETPRVGEVAPGYLATSLRHRWTRTDTWVAHPTNAEATTAETTAPLAVKVPRRLPASAYTRAELAAEYERATRLQHPGLARPINAELRGEQPYAVYQGVDGPTLSELAAETDAVAPETVLRMGADLARALAYLHRLGYAHLGLNADVVSIGVAGAIITDLKHALPIGAQPLGGREPQRRGERPRGGVISPEQHHGDAAAAAMDMFALGALLAGFEAPLPEAMAALVSAMLDPDPNQRPTAQKALALLRPQILPVSPRPEAPREPVGSATDRAIA